MPIAVIRDRHKGAKHGKNLVARQHICRERIPACAGMTTKKVAHVKDAVRMVTRRNTVGASPAPDHGMTVSRAATWLNAALCRGPVAARRRPGMPKRYFAKALRPIGN